MNKQEKAKLAREEYADPKNAIRQGGVNGNPFWNIRAIQFMFCPAFDFSPIAGCDSYLYEAVDESGKKYEFKAETTTELLTPFWDELVPGQVQLMVYALDKDGNKFATVGARSFHKSAPFTGDYPEAVCSYEEAAKRAYEYTFSMPAIQHWAETGLPDPDYDLYIYIAKMNASIINGMINYAKLSPENAERAMLIATNAADFLISVSEPEGSPLEGLPPTYYNPAGKDFGAGYEHSMGRLKENMLIYPADAGVAYLNLYSATNDKKYYDAAMVIAKYYKNTVHENGTWPQLVSVETGESTSSAYCIPNKICAFLYKVYEITKGQDYKELADNAYEYIRNVCLKTYHWEGQFEDAAISIRYSNMTHFPAETIIKDILENHSDDEDQIREAEELMRYIEDQFVVWDKPSKYNKDKRDTALWHYPSALEQYNWYVPIDSSTAAVANAFVMLHKLTKKPLYLEKACVLADSITRIQNPRTGMIPTHWIEPSCVEDGGLLWINCMIMTANTLFDFSDYLKKIEK